MNLKPRTRFHAGGLAAALGLGSMFGPGAVAVGAAAGTTCAVEHVVSIEPGVSLQGSTGTFEDSELGTVVCDGPIKGVTPTGPGTFHEKGRYGIEDPDDCLTGGEGEGAYTLVFPTADGPKTVKLPFTVDFGDPSPSANGIVGIHVRGEGWAGEYGGFPAEGNCVSQPITKLAIKGKAVFG